MLSEEVHPIRGRHCLHNGSLFCAREATENTNLSQRDKILRACTSLVTQLQRTAARIIVSMPNPLPSRVQVTVGGRNFSEEYWGKPYFFKPGENSVDASAPGCIDFHEKLSVEPGEERTVFVALLPLPKR